MLGVEPSAILSFRDEYLRLADDKESANELSENCFIIEEFLKQELAVGNIRKEHFTNQAAVIKIHGHCHQKALSNTSRTFDILNIPENYKVTIIPSGCCGMAGSFGFKKEHYDVSKSIGERSLFGPIRSADTDVAVVSEGVSCRQHITDNTGRSAIHLVELIASII